MKPLVSVIIPTYNRGYTIERCISSVLNQTYNELEVIIVDDGSNDCTKEIIGKIVDNRIHYVVLEKQVGACSARNIGIDMSNGSIIAFQDSDDEWELDKIEKQVEILLHRDDIDIIFCKIKRFEESKELDVFPNLNKDLIVSYDQLLAGNLISTQTMLGYTECFKKIKFDKNMKRFQDWEIALRLVKEYQIYFLNQALVKVYLQNDSISKSNIKTVSGLESIIVKNIVAYKGNPEILYDLYGYLARTMVLCEINPKKIYSEMLKIKFEKKIFLKYVFATFSLQMRRRRKV